jgi:hypothetical protein
MENIKAGFDKFGADSEPLYSLKDNWEGAWTPGLVKICFDTHYTQYIDSKTGFFMFDMPISNGNAQCSQKTFPYSDAYNSCDFTVTLTHTPKGEFYIK